MKTKILNLLIVFMMTALATHARAFTKKEFDEAMGDLGSQLNKIDKTSPKTCPENYRGIFSNKKVRISIFYGYENYEEENHTFDRRRFKAFTKVLTEPCEGNIQTCDFKIIEQNSNKVVLQKSVNGHDVLLRLFTSSVTEEDVTYSLRIEQNKMSNHIRDEFFKALKTDQVVYYSGHSRVGGGPGFYAQSPVEIGFFSIFRMPMMPFLEALAQPKSSLKLLGLISCDSNKYYRADIQRVRPDLSLLISKDEIEDIEGEQVMIGSLNSILGEKCSQEFKESIISEERPQHKVMTLVPGR